MQQQVYNSLSDAGVLSCGHEGFCCESDLSQAATAEPVMASQSQALTHIHGRPGQACSGIMSFRDKTWDMRGHNVHASRTIGDGTRQGGVLWRLSNMHSCAEGA
jgi:hypothetical protein